MSDITLSEQLRQVQGLIERGHFKRSALDEAFLTMPSLIERVEALEADMERMAWAGFEEGYMAAFSGEVLNHDTVREAWLRCETYRINWGDGVGP